VEGPGVAEGAASRDGHATQGLDQRDRALGIILGFQERADEKPLDEKRRMLGVDDESDGGLRI